MTKRPLRSPSMNHFRGVPSTNLVGLMALVFSALYFASDVIEAIQGPLTKPRGQFAPTRQA
jgi:hypothetical protein